VRSLRKQFVARTVIDALRDSNSERFRIAHYSVQENHLHLIVEADSKAALSTGMRSLMVRLAKRVNKLLFRSGRFWADRWHGNALTAPRQVRNALVYVLQNRKKPAHPASREPNASVDPLSSANWFDGFADPIPIAPGHLKSPAVMSP
jgi:REP element-mobilizing transposase RayT